MRFVLAVLMSVTIWVPFAAVYLLWVEASRELLILVGSLAVNAFLLWLFMRLEAAAED